MSLTDDLYNELDGTPLGHLATQLGLSDEQARVGLATALPLLIGALGRNAQEPQGAASLFDALGRDHVNQDPRSALAGALAGAGGGASILEHVFGSRQRAAEQGLGAATGLGADRSQALLRLLAPAVLAFLAKKMYDRRQAGSAAAEASANPGAAIPTPGELGGMLGREQETIASRGGVGGQLLNRVLDRDRDGDVDFSDLAGLAGMAGALAKGIGAARPR